MSTKNIQGKQTNEDQLLSVTGTEGIASTETASNITLSVDLPSLTEDTTPDVNNDYIIIHSNVSGEKKKMILAYVESLGSLGSQVDVFPEAVQNARWVKPAGSKHHTFILWGSGGGGGSGQVGAPSTDRIGGGGGGGGQWVQYVFPTEIIRDECFISVAPGGFGAHRTRAPAEIGRAGFVGNTTWVLALTTNLYLGAAGGGAGNGAGTTSNAGGAAGGTWAGAGGAGDDGPPATGNVGGNSNLGGAGGGAGGGFDTTSNATANGGNGGYSLIAGYAAAAGGTGVGGHGANGVDNIMVGGGGGGGGASSNDASINGGDGGNGGWPGGGGGGGGSATSGNNACTGAAGKGADGAVIIISYF